MFVWITRRWLFGSLLSYGRYSMYVHTPTIAFILCCCFCQLLSSIVNYIEVNRMAAACGRRCSDNADESERLIRARSFRLPSGVAWRCFGDDNVVCLLSVCQRVLKVDFFARRASETTVYWFQMVSVRCGGNECVLNVFSVLFQLIIYLILCIDYQNVCFIS